MKETWTLEEWMNEFDPEETVVRLEAIRTVDGVPNVAVVRGYAVHTVPGGFNSWKWCIPLLEDGVTMTGGGNPHAYIWGQDWFDFVEEYRRESK